MSDNPFDYQPAAPKYSSPVVDAIQAIVIALAIVVVVYLFLIVPSQVDGPSMQNNFQNGDLLLGNKLIQLIGNTDLGQRLDYDYKRGDVVVFDKPDFHDQPIIKRIIATPGDRVMFVESRLIVNGNIVDEHYIPKTPDFRTFLADEQFAFIKEGEEKTVPEGKYFVMGDNRQHSIDSRFSSIGWVDRSEIRGRVFIRFWPLGSFGLIQRGSYTETPYTGDVL